MPTQLASDLEVPEIKVKTAYNGEVMITYINPNITLEELNKEMRNICHFSPDQVFTMKWVDGEGDPCIIGTETELAEAIRLYDVNMDAELTIHARDRTYNCNIGPNGVFLEARQCGLDALFVESFTNVSR